MIFAVIAGAVFGGFALVLTYAAIGAGVETRHSIAALSQCRCPACGVVYGREAATQAPERYRERCARVQHERPEVRINFVREWSVLCLACGSEGYFDCRADELHAEPRLGREYQ